MKTLKDDPPNPHWLNQSNLGGA